MINVATDSSINMLLVDKSNRVYTLTELNSFANRFKELVRKDPSIGSINTAFSPDAPAYELTIDLLSFRLWAFLLKRRLLCFKSSLGAAE